MSFFVGKEQAVKVAHSWVEQASRLYSSRADGISTADRVIYRYKRTALLYRRSTSFFFYLVAQLIWSPSIKIFSTRQNRHGDGTNTSGKEDKPLPEQRIDADRRFVQDEQLRFVKQSDGEGNASLLSAAERFDVAMTRRQIEQVEQELHLRFDEGGGQVVDAPKVLQRLFDGEFAIESQFLWHVADPRTGDPAFDRAGLSTEHEHLTAVEAAPANDAAE